MTVFNESEVNSLSLASRVSGTLSLISTLAILGDHLYNRIRGAPATSSSRIILWWTMCDLIVTPFLVLGRDFVPEPHDALSPSVWCQAQGIVINFAYIASACWAMLMAATSYLAVCWKWSLRDIVRYERTWFHAFAWGLPLIMTAVPIFTAPITRNSLVTHEPAALWGDATYYCWISNGWAPYRMYFFYNAIIGCFFLNLIMYVRVGMEIWRVFNEANTMGKVSSTPHTRFHARYRFAIKCSMYLAVFVLVYGFALTNRVETLVNPDNPLFALAMLHGIMFPLKGTLNALVYFSSHIMARAGGVLYHSGDSTDGSSGQKTGTSASASASHSHSHSRMEFGLSSRTGNVPLTGSIASQTPRPPASPAPMRWPESDIKSAGGSYAAPVPTFEKPRPTYGAASPAPPGGDGSGQGGRGAGGAPQRPMYF
ncbi:hypothetical protein GGF32_000554 [Allomyces javanicus]|nr:hypothetical protein GGF32_000554 [Allomyces javanicus]